MNANLRRMVSGIAALGIALSGMALGAGSAWATEGGGNGAYPSVAIGDEAIGTITISGGEIEHTFNGYRLGYLTSISYDENDVMTGYTLETTKIYKDAIKTALGNITVDNQTLLASYQADNSYCAKECADSVAAGAGDPNPLGWFFANYGDDGLFEADDTYEDEANWGGDAKDGSNASVLRQFATEVSTAIKGMDSTSADVQSLTSSEDGQENTVPQGFYLLRDTTTIDAGTDAKEDPNKETQSAPILVSTTYTVNIPVAGEDGEGNPTTENEDVTFTSDGTNDLGQVSLKNSTPIVTKKVVKPAENPAEGSPKYVVQDQPDYAVGDAVYYELTATLPYYTGYANGNRVYKITDTASVGLTINEVVSVKVDPATDTYAEDSENAASEQALVKGTDYTVTTESITDGDAPYEDGWTTTIDLAKYVNLAEGTQSKNAKILEGGTVTVILKATLNDKALISDSNNAQGNPSKDSLTYSNKPEDVAETHTTPGDEVNVYTYRFRLHKTDKGGNDLEGATFHVSAPDNANEWLAWDADNNKWTYEEDEDNATDFTSGEDGNVVGLIDPEEEIEGGKTVNLDRLDSGTYTVKETAAPEGYTQAFLPKFTFTITPTMNGEDGQKTITDATFSGKNEITGEGKGYVTESAAIADGDDEGAWQYTVYNAKNLTELPMTGGAGLAAVIAVGVLLGGAGIAAAVRSRKSNTRAVRA